MLRDQRAKETADETRERCEERNDTLKDKRAKETTDETRKRRDKRTKELDKDKRNTNLQAMRAKETKDQRRERCEQRRRQEQKLLDEREATLARAQAEREHRVRENGRVTNSPQHKADRRVLRALNNVLAADPDLELEAVSLERARRAPRDAPRFVNEHSAAFGQSHYTLAELMDMARLPPPAARQRSCSPRRDCSPRCIVRRQGLCGV